MKRKLWILSMVALLVCTGAGTVRSTIPPISGTGTRVDKEKTFTAFQLSDERMDSVVGGASYCWSSKTSDGWSCAGCCLDLWIFSVCGSVCVPFELWS